MSYFKDVRCIRCGASLGQGKFYEACPSCLDMGTVNYTTTYDVSGAKLPTEKSGPGLFRYRDFLPIAPEAKPVSIGEGDTPLIRLERLGKKLGIPNLYVKDESRNPTLSYKDRLIAVVTTKAAHEGAPGLTISSTGNHGAAAAAYCAAAGLPCLIFTIPEVPETMKTLMQAYGACVIVTPTPMDRWTIMRKCVEEFGYVPASGFVSPPIGSNCYGIDGYKTIAFELYEQLGGAADMVIMPACYSDGIYGAYKGMQDLLSMGYIKKLPKMVAAEVFGSMEETLKQGAEFPVTVPAAPSIAFSIAGSICTYQGLEAVRKSDGFARSSSDDETIKMQLLLASTEGIYAEAASVTTLVAAEKLAGEGKISTGDNVVAVLTSTGLKDPATTKKHLPPVPVIEPNVEALRRALKDSYGVTI